MKRIQKKSVILTSLIFTIILLLNLIPFSAKAEEQRGKPQALSWLKEMGEESGEWKNAGLPNFTCNAMAVLREEKNETDSTFLTKWEQEHTVLNVDELAHLAWARGCQSYLDTAWEWQNEDGGFGLTESYTSDVYDTMLVLLAQEAVWEKDGLEEITDSTEQKYHSDRMTKAVNYLIGQQKADGGFGYTKFDISVPELSAQVGIVLLLASVDNASVYEKLDSYCQNVFTADFSEETFLEQAKLAGYLYKRELINDTDDVEKKLNAVQAEDGSVYGSVKDTIQYILLVREIEQYHSLKFEIKNLITEADNYVLEADRKQQVSLQTTIQYTINQEMKAVIRYTLLEDGEIIKTEEKECLFIPKQEEQKTDAVMDIVATEGRTYVLRTEVLSKEDAGIENIWKSTEFNFTVHKKEKPELKLTCTVKDGEDYGIELDWNDITNDDERYGYRVFRKQGDGVWETRSTWNGNEKVRVLNIYPRLTAENYLVDWMETTVSGTGEPAGKGLFDIDTVYIDDYNTEPEEYLFDEDGNYKYDVLMFGSSDYNGPIGSPKDLNEKSYIATKKFIDSGRGALFGHDTLWYQPYFLKFSDMLGMKMGGASSGFSNKVKVVKQGFLTGYPWNLSGTLDIPWTHTQGQCSGGSLGSTVWMELETNGNCTDSATGVTSSAYLFTNNQLAMIQTGHSNGLATDDERKVLANTLFYLKQFTYSTGSADKSFYDLDAPVVDDLEISDNDIATIYGEDRGTTYQYYVEGIAASSETENIQSNIVTATALSGLKGYIVEVSDKEHIEDIAEYDEKGNLISDIVPANQEKATVNLGECTPGTTVYIHIRPVDNAGNIGEEFVQEIEIPDNESYFDLPYALFASEEEVQLFCCQADVKGIVYGNETFRFQGSTLNLLGTAYSAGKLQIAGGDLHIAEKIENASQIELPNYMTDILDNMKQNTGIEEIAEYNMANVTNPTICKTTTKAWCNRVNIFADLVSNGDISFNANVMTLGYKDPVVIASENGDITIQATNVNGNGLIYAPNGTVTINVCDFDYKGSIIAKKINIQATYYQHKIEDK